MCHRSYLILLSPYTWKDDLADVTSYQFEFHKEPVERYLNTFYNNKPKMKGSGYMRTIVVFFSEGPPHPDTGAKTIKAMLQVWSLLVTYHSFDSTKQCYVSCKKRFAPCANKPKNSQPKEFVEE